MTQIVILAAGRGSRMGDKLPKVLVALKGQAIINHLLDSVFLSGVDFKPIIVVSPDNIDVIKQSLSKYPVQYAIQSEQLGTGHALSCAREKLSPGVDRIMVLYGDHPFIKGKSIKKFALANSSVITVMPTKLPDFSGWRSNFYHWGRFIRNKKGEITEIVEFKDASVNEKLITEVNPGFMCFSKKWLLDNIDHLKNNNNAQEYYLTDMVKIAFDRGANIATVDINPREAVGINTKKELEIAEQLI